MWAVAGAVAVILAKCLRDFRMPPIEEDAFYRYGFTFLAALLQAGVLALMPGGTMAAIL